MNTFFAYVSTIVPLVVLDGIWILILAKGFYARQVGFLFAEKANVVPVLFFYPLYALALLFLAVMPAVSAHSGMEALWRGALIGLAAYGAYDLTNHATISGWPLKMTLVDMGWGVLVSALASVIAYLVIMHYRF